MMRIKQTWKEKKMSLTTAMRDILIPARVNLLISLTSMVCPSPPPPPAPPQTST